MEPLIEYRLELAGYRTRALELEGDGPPLVLLHGFADSADTWRLMLDHLARRGRRALAVDLPGFGNASRLAAGSMLDQLDRFTKAAIEHVAPEGGALVCGNSLGGCLAMRAAEDDGAGVAGIIPIAPAGLDMARWFVLVERDPVVRTLLAAPMPVPGFIVRRGVGEVYRRLAFARPGDIDGRVASTFASHFDSRARVAEILALGRRLLPELRDPFRLERIGCPVLLVWGAQDLLVFRTGGQRVTEAVANARIAVIDACGHCPQIEAVERLIALLADFAAEPTAAG